MNNDDKYVMFCDDTKLSGKVNITPESEQAWLEVKDSLLKECCSFINGTH